MLRSSQHAVALLSILIFCLTSGGAAAGFGHNVSGPKLQAGSGSGQEAPLLPHCNFDSARPKQYIAYKTDTPPLIDGDLTDSAWMGVPWTDSFVDIFDRPDPRFQTRAKMRWDAQWLYIAAELEEPSVWANITAHNEVIYQDNDFEVFVCADGSNHYYKEFEINVNNATWDLCLNKPYIDLGYENSTRVLGRGGWEMQPPLRSAVQVNGDGCRINNASTSHLCRGWSVELAMPLKHLAFNTTAIVPPVPGQSFWRINFSRVEYHVQASGSMYTKTGDSSDPDNWVWSAQGAINMHLPERWGILQFAEGPLNGTKELPYPGWTLRHVAMSLYYAQQAYYSKTKAYANRTAELEALAPPGTLDGSCTGAITIRASDNRQHYVAELQSKKLGGYMACIRDDRLLRVTEAAAAYATSGCMLDHMIARQSDDKQVHLLNQKEMHVNHDYAFLAQ